MWRLQSPTCSASRWRQIPGRLLRCSTCLSPRASMSDDIQIKQLNDARQLVLGDATYYSQIVQSILPIIGRDARVELRRWGADFLAETFSSPVYPSAQKETLSLTVLETMLALIENTNEDAAVVKSIVQTAASIYPLVFRWM